MPPVLATQGPGVSPEVHGGAVQDVAELRAVTEGDRFDKQVRLVEDKGEHYYFDSTGVGADDGDETLVPDVGGGRWFKTGMAAGAHAVDHQDGGTDELPVASLAEAAAPGNDVSRALRPDGVGGVEFLDINYSELIGTNPSWALDGSTTPTATMPAGTQLITGLAGIEIVKIAGATPISDATQLDSRKAEWQSHLFPTGGPAAIRSGFIRLEAITTIEDQHQFTFSTTDDGGSENDFISIRRNSTSGNVEFRVPSSATGFDFIKPGFDTSPLGITSGGSWELRTGNGAVQIQNAGSSWTILQDGKVANNMGLGFGTSTDVKLEWSSVQTPDAFMFGMQGTGVDSDVCIFTLASRIGTLDYTVNTRLQPSFLWTDGTTDKTDSTYQYSDGKILYFDEYSATGTTKIATKSTGGIRLLGQAFPLRDLAASQMDFPNTADWAVNAFAEQAADTNNDGLTVRLFDPDAEEGAGDEFDVPDDATKVRVVTISRPETGPAGSVTAKTKLYAREIAHPTTPAAVTGWTGVAAMDIVFPATNEFFVIDVIEITLASLGINAGGRSQIQFTRDAANGSDNLLSDLAFKSIKIGFI